MSDTWLTPDGRRELLREYAGRYPHIKRFIESGTYLGDTPAALVDLFPEIHTIELHPVMYERARERFAATPHVHVHHGDSGVVLHNLLPKGGSALLWLDGHFTSEGDTAHGVVDTPIRAELHAVMVSRARHVVLIDDARCFRGGAGHDSVLHRDYPTLDWVRLYAESHHYDVVIADDVIRLTPVV